MIQEYNGSGTLLNNYLHGAGMDELVARFGANNASRLWYYQDGRGNTSHVADEFGALVETYTYDLGGKPFYSTAAGKTWPNNRFLYNGRDYSLFTGLYDFRNRFYDPWSSRFVQSDPIGFAGGNHLYRFCGNSAVNAGDPLGLFVTYQNNPPTQADQPPSFQDLSFDFMTVGVADRVIVSATSTPEPGRTEIIAGNGSLGVDAFMLDTAISEGGYNLNGASPGDGAKLQLQLQKGSYSSVGDDAQAVPFDGRVWVSASAIVPGGAAFFYGPGAAFLGAGHFLPDIALWANIRGPGEGGPWSTENELSDRNKFLRAVGTRFASGNMAALANVTNAFGIGAAAVTAAPLIGAAGMYALAHPPVIVAVGTAVGQFTSPSGPIAIRPSVAGALSNLFYNTYVAPSPIGP